MSDLAREIAQTVVRIKSEMRKAQFASRSEAGRYAANQRWKGQGKKGKTPVDDLSIRGMTQTKWNIDELRTHIDEQEGLLEAMRDIGASKAELKQQKGLITLARRDLRRMEEEQEEVVGVNKFPVAADAEKQSSNHANFMRLREESAVDKAFSRKSLSTSGAYLRGEKYKDIGVKPLNVDAKDATEEDYAFAEKSLKEIKEVQEPLLDQASKAILDFDNGRASAEVSIKALRGVRNKLKKEGVKVLAQQKADGFFPESKSETTIRSMIYYTKSLQFDFAARWVDGALGEIVSFTKGKGNYVINDMAKAKSFASRSEAGRYAANMRWKGQGQATSAGGQLAKESPTSSAVHVDTIMGNVTTSGRKKKRKKPVVQDIELAKADSPAWQTKEGKNPKGGLNAKGRASYKRETGGTLKPPVKRGDNPRRASFLARMGNMPGPERDANGEPTRLLLSLQAWGASSKADARKKAAAISARNENKKES